MPFDAERLEVRGAEVPLLDTVAQALSAGNSDDFTGAGQVAIAPGGTLAWVPGPVAPYPDKVLVTVDRRGRVSPLPAPVRGFFPVVRVSPDGHRLALMIPTLTEVGLWVYDLTRGTLTPLNTVGESTWPMWSPDGQRLTFQWLTGGRPSLAVQPADGTAPPRTLAAGLLLPASSTPDGRQLVAVLDEDIVTVTLNDGAASVQPLIQTPHYEGVPLLSPDGRWAAYVSHASGRSEVYVRPYPGPGPAEPVSLDRSGNPAWHPNGRELFFIDGPGPAAQYRMMAVDFMPGSPPRIGRPRPLFVFDPRELNLRCEPVRCYDVAPDGERFYAVQNRKPPPPPVVTHINLILNWFEELKAKVPSGQPD